MILTRAGDSLTALCPAKINLFLEVRGRRPDGYHDIETVMQAVTLYDEVTLGTRSDGRLELRCSDSTLPSGPDNIAFKAAELLRTYARFTGGVSIVLEKRIPHGAGLGGGSSDAAGVLIGLNELWQLGLTLEQLHPLAARLGSDVPFFLYGGTALCTGRGETVTPISTNFVAHYVLCCPPVSLSTALVYSRLDSLGLTTATESANFLLFSLARDSFDAVRAVAFNRLDTAAVSMAPEIASVKRLLAEAASGPALVSGSGSCVYAMLESAARAEEVARAVRAAGLSHVFVARTEPPTFPRGASPIPGRTA